MGLLSLSNLEIYIKKTGPEKKTLRIRAKTHLKIVFFLQREEGLRLLYS